MRRHADFSGVTGVGLAAVWCALWAAAVELALTVGTRVFRNGLTFYGREQWWVVPASITAYFLVLAVPLAGLGVVRPRWMPFRVAAGLLAGVAVMTTLLSRPQIAVMASLVLAAGLGIQVYRWVAADPARSRQVMWRQVFLLVALSGIASVTQWVHDARSSRRALAGAADASAGAPNVLLLILDTVRAASLSAYGYSRPTSPRLEQVAREGVAFDWALSTAPWTLPSHATMFTGRYGPELSTDWKRRLDGTHPTLAEVLSRRGYRTAAFVANRNYAGHGTGLARGFREYHDTQLDAKQVLLSSPVGQIAGIRALLRALAAGDWPGLRAGIADFSLYVDPDPAFSRRTGHDLADQFLQWESGAAQGPYFAFLNFYDAHEPYLPDADLAARFTGGEAMRDAYDASIATVDRQVGRLLDTLRARGRLDNTIVIVTSDHGELLGEHGLRWHSFMMYIDVLRVPLIVRYPPGVPSGRRVARPVSLRDLSATVLDLAAVPVPGWPGMSLAGHWSDSTTRTSPALSHVTRALNVESFWPASRGPLASLVESPWHYMRNGDDTEELYNLATDPGEAANLATPPGDPVLRALRQRTDSAGRHER